VNVVVEPTNYSESNALLALIQGDEDEAREILADMLPGELVGLAEAADRLHHLAAWEYLPAARQKQAAQERTEALDSIPTQPDPPGGR
jgi:plasmid stability protein